MNNKNTKNNDSKNEKLFKRLLRIHRSDTVRLKRLGIKLASQLCCVHAADHLKRLWRTEIELEDD